MLSKATLSTQRKLPKSKGGGAGLGRRRTEKPGAVSRMLYNRRVFGVEVDEGLVLRRVTVKEVWRRSWAGW